MSWTYTCEEKPVYQYDEFNMFTTCKIKHPKLSTSLEFEIPEHEATKTIKFLNTNCTEKNKCNVTCNFLSVLFFKDSKKIYDLPLSEIKCSSLSTCPNFEIEFNKMFY